MTENSRVQLDFNVPYSRNSHLVAIFLDEGGLPDNVREILGSHEARLEVAVQDVEPLMLLPPEVITEINRHFSQEYSYAVLLQFLPEDVII